MYAENVHENVTEIDLVKLFDLRTTNYLIDNCSFKILNLKQNGRHNCHAFILALCHVLVKAWNFMAVKLLLKKLKHRLRL